MVDRIAGFLDRLFNQYKFVRRFSLFWVIGLVTAIVAFTMLADPERITDPISRIYVACIGLVAVIIGLYQWLRGNDQ